MAIQTINSNSVEPLGGPNLGLSVEQGDSWAAAVTKLNAMFVDLYNGGGNISFQAGGSAGATGQYKASGNVAKIAGPIGSSATNTTQTLASYTMPANMFNAAGQELELTVWGTTAANAAPKRVTLNVGGTTYTTGTQNMNAAPFEISGIYMRGNAASTQNAVFSGVSSGTLVITPVNSTDTSVETGTIAVTVTMADASAAQSNVLLYGFTVEYFG